MTLIVAWVRKTTESSELVFASDSRLSGGGNVDHCQKVFALPREDCCIAFAGSTLIAYPFIMQLQNIILDYKKVFDRAVDVTRLTGRVVALLNRFVESHEDTVDGDFEEDLKHTYFLFGGWSWKLSKFVIWNIKYDTGKKKYISASTGIWETFGLPRSEPAEVAFAGDYTGHFLRELTDALSGKLKYQPYKIGQFALDYEPLNVLARMLQNPTYIDRQGELKGLIGGGPQVLKVYPFMRTMHYAVEWEIKSKFVYVLKGRVVQDYEILTVLGINPITGETARPVQGRLSDTQVTELLAKGLPGLKFNM